MKVNSFSILVLVLLGINVYGAEHHHHEMSSIETKISDKVIEGKGKIKFIAEDHMSIRIFHDPIVELKWPSMNMLFEISDHHLVHSLEVGDRVSFEFVQKDGKNIITKITK